MFTTLSDGRPGIRHAIQIEVRTPRPEAELKEAPTGVSDSPAEHSNHSQPILEFVASDESLDRYQEVISASGWRLDTYRRNPVFQNAHQYGDILFTLGKSLVTEVRSGNSSGSHDSPLATSHFLFQRIEFATDINPVARIAYGLYKGGFLRAVSVGFIPLRWEDPPSPKGYGGQVLASANGRGQQTPRRRYLEQELLEVSAVGIPANPNALALGLKSGAVEKSDLRETLELLDSLASSLKAARPTGSGALEGLNLNQQQLEWLFLARELQRILRCA
jgi:hypothetical protein